MARMLCLASILFGLHVAFAASIQFDVFPGYDNTVREAHWFPVTFEVKNDGPGFAGFIEFASAQFGGNQVRRIPLELPTGTLKRITIPVFSANNYASWTARLKTERGKTLIEQEIPPNQLKHRSPSTVLLGAVSRSASGQPSLPPIKRPQAELQPTVTRLQPSIFPDNPITLEGVECIYLNSERALDLRQPQVSALIGWLHSGGHLIVGLEQIGDINGTPWLRELLPCDVTSVAPVKTAGRFRDWLQRGNLWTAAGSLIQPDPTFERASIEVVAATVRDGHVIAPGDGEVPLAIEAPRGNGKITVLLFSPERQPFISWQNRSWFWATLAGVSPQLYQSSDYYNYGGWSTDGVFGAMIESKQVRKLPFGYLLLLLVAYLAVIGPIDQIWLKRMNRQMLTWLTFPIYVVAFSGLIYFIGFKLRAGDSEWNELHVVDVLPKSQGAVLRGHTFASIYSPSNERYALQGQQPIACLRGEYMANYGNASENTQADVVYHGNNFDAEVFVPVWTSQLYINDWYQPLSQAPLKLTLGGHRGDKLEATVQNASDHKLVNVRICVGSRIYEVGELPAKATKTISLPNNGGEALQAFVKKYGSQFSMAVESRRRTFGSSDPLVFELPNASMAACFITQIDEQQNYRRFIPSSGVDLTRFADSDHAIVLAWDADHSPTTPLKQFSSRRNAKNTLYRMVVPIEPEL